MNCELLKGRRAYEGEDAEDRESEEKIFFFFLNNNKGQNIIYK